MKRMDSGTNDRVALRQHTQAKTWPMAWGRGARATRVVFKVIEGARCRRHGCGSSYTTDEDCDIRHAFSQLRCPPAFGRQIQEPTRRNLLAQLGGASEKA
ncbi:hypothetical protein BKA80DRAFT_110327 [Phyllosticta citrichinensis]